MKVKFIIILVLVDVLKFSIFSFHLIDYNKQVLVVVFHI